MVVDRFEVFRFDDIGVDTRFGVEAGGDVAHHVFDEFGVVVGAFGDVFFVRALEQAVQLWEASCSTSWTISSIHMKSLVRR